MTGHLAVAGGGSDQNDDQNDRDGADDAGDVGGQYSGDSGRGVAVSCLDRSTLRLLLSQ